MARIKTRYGYSQQVSDPDDPWITRKLIAELRSEQFDEPDDEHTQVAVGNEHWSVSRTGQRSDYVRQHGSA